MYVLYGSGNHVSLPLVQVLLNPVLYGMRHRRRVPVSGKAASAFLQNDFRDGIGIHGSTGTLFHDCVKFAYSVMQIVKYFATL